MCVYIGIHSEDRKFVETNLKEISSEGDRIQWGEGLKENNRTGGENKVRYEKAGSRKEYVRDN